MSHIMCDVCKLEFNNKDCEEKCCGVFICMNCVVNSRFCPREGCTKYLENSIQDIVIKKGYFDEILAIGQKQNYMDVKYGLTPIEIAVVWNDIYILRNLLRYQMYDKTKRVIDLAIEKYHLEIIRVLKDHGFPFDYQTPLQLQDDYPFLTSQEAYQLLRI